MKEVQADAYLETLQQHQAHQEPLVIRGLGTDMPLVQAANTGSASLFHLLRSHASTERVNALEAPTSIDGKLGYRTNPKRFNFERTTISLEAFFQRLLNTQSRPTSPLLAIQSAYVSDYFASLEPSLRLTAWPTTAPRIWIGNRTVARVHYDDSDNIALVVAGRRRFSLFPPEQIHNLYIGPIDHTPSGAAISLVDIDNPDYDRFPRYARAEKARYDVELEPGDAIFIPTLWWHQVSALDAINVLLNYWQGGSISETNAINPSQAMLLARLALQGRGPNQRKAWANMFQHYVFDDHDLARAHLDESVRGVLGTFDIDEASRFVATLVSSSTS